MTPQVECTVLLEEAAVLSCADRIDEAIGKQQQSLLLADLLADGTFPRLRFQRPVSVLCFWRCVFEGRVLYERSRWG